MSDESAETVICTFRVRAGHEDEMIALCRKHDATLRELGLVTGQPAVLYRGADEAGQPFLVKIFEWKSAAALDAARRHPDVQMQWEAMEPHCEARGGQLSMEFPHVVRVSI